MRSLYLNIDYFYRADITVIDITEKGSDFIQYSIMITVIRTGAYRLFETHEKKGLLVLDGKSIYSWDLKNTPEKLWISPRTSIKTHTTLSTGKYRLYDVKNESNLTENLHLELMIAQGKWQGYVLPTGFPREVNTKKQIIPTEERITCSSLCLLKNNYRANRSSSSPLS